MAILEVVGKIMTSRSDSMKNDFIALNGNK